jgi:8-oxo-dGTP diphosphatase
MQFKKDITQFHYKVRVRVCGLLIVNHRLLLIKHKGIGSNGFLWSPPGGGIEFGEDIKTCLKREFLEEVNLHIEVGDFLFGSEYIDQSKHSVELFFPVIHYSGDLKLGSDPELDKSHQILTECRFFSSEELSEIPFSNKHNVFHQCENVSDLLDLKGFYFFGNN